MGERPRGQGRAPPVPLSPSSGMGGMGGTGNPSAAPPVRQMYIRKAISANARADVAGYCAPVALPSPPPPPCATRGFYEEVSAAAVAVAAAAALPPRAGAEWRAAGSSGQVLADGRPPLPLPRVPHLSQPLFGFQPQALPAGPLQGGIGVVAGTAAAGPRGGALPPPRGSAAERMLDVLRTLGVVGPSGIPTAGAQYVTAVVMEFADAVSGPSDLLASWAP